MKAFTARVCAPRWTTTLVQFILYRYDRNSEQNVRVFPLYVRVLMLDLKIPYTCSLTILLEYVVEYFICGK